MIMPPGTVPAPARDAGRQHLLPQNHPAETTAPALGNTAQAKQFARHILSAASRSPRDGHRYAAQATLRIDRKSHPPWAATRPHGTSLGTSGNSGVRSIASRYPLARPESSRHGPAQFPCRPTPIPMPPLAEQSWETHPERILLRSWDRLTSPSPDRSPRRQGQVSPDPCSSWPRDPTWFDYEPPLGGDHRSNSLPPDTAPQCGQPESPYPLLVRREIPHALIPSPTPSTKWCHAFTEKP